MAKQRAMFYSKVFCLVFLTVAALQAEVHSSDDETKGQPEFQQPLDNNPQQNPENHLQVSTEEKNSGLIASRTLDMLNAALRMLNRITNKERRMIENFIYKLRKMVIGLEEERADAKKQKKESEYLLQLSPTPSPTSNIQSTPKMNKMLSKYHVTSAQMNDVLPANERIMNPFVVTKPGVNMKMLEEEDELVKQLHAQEALQKQEREAQRDHVTYHTRPLDSTKAALATAPTTPVGSNDISAVSDKEMKRKMLISNLLREMDELKRLGETEKEANELAKALKSDHYNTAGTLYDGNMNA